MTNHMQNYGKNGSRYPSKLSPNSYESTTFLINWNKKFETITRSVKHISQTQDSEIILEPNSNKKFRKLKNNMESDLPTIINLKIIYWLVIWKASLYKLSNTKMIP